MKDSKSNSVLTGALALLLTGTVVLSGIMTSTVTRVTKQSAVEYTQALAESQLTAIEDFVSRQEKRLLDYARLPEVRELLSAKQKLDSASEAGLASAQNEYAMKQASVQEYINAISADAREEGMDESVYVSTWFTEVLAHSDTASIGDSPFTVGSQQLVDLQNGMTGAAEDSVYHAGIILSHFGSHEQILSLYKGIFDTDGTPLGFVGMGVKTEGLEQNLGFEITGLPNAKFSLINVSDDKYIFHQGESIKNVVSVGNGIEKYEYKTAENPEFLEISSGYRNGTNKNKTGVFQSGKTVSCYAYSEVYGWIYQIEDSGSELYAAAGQVRLFMILFLLVIAIVAVVIFFIYRRMTVTDAVLMHSFKKQELTQRELDSSRDRDSLTHSKSRLAFLHDFSHGSQKSVYFVLHGFQSLSDANLLIGMEQADKLLKEFAQELFSVYSTENVYRTGDKEFLCVIDGERNEQEQILAKINSLHSHLSQTRTFPGGVFFTPVIDTVIVRQSRADKLSALPVLRDTAKKNRPVYVGKIPFLNLDETRQ